MLLSRLLPALAAPLPGSNMTVEDGLMTAGGVLLLIKLVGLVVAIVRALFARFLRPAINFRKCGQWAVITGATDGIGRAYAFELAKKGMDIILISRTQSKLDATAAEIKEAHPNTDVRTLAVDFAASEADVYPRIEKEIGSLDIGVLVNNVGISYEYPDYFENVSDLRLQQLVSLNVTAVTRMTKIVLPGMSDRRRGAIVNISSGSGTFPCPMLTVYSATKAYMDFFSRGLEAEVASRGVIVQSVTPFFVASKLSKLRPSLTTPTPAAYCRQAVATIGRDSRTFGFMLHNLQGWIMHAIPESFLVSQVLKLHKAIRSKAMKRKEQKKEQ